MKTNTPEQMSIPGLPPPDRTKEYRAMLAFQTKEAAASLKDMKDTALELAELAADAISRMPNAPDGVARLANDFVKYRASWIAHTKAAGIYAERLREAAHIPLLHAADAEDDFDDEEGGEE